MDKIFVVFCTETTPEQDETSWVLNHTFYPTRESAYEDMEGLFRSRKNALVEEYNLEDIDESEANGILNFSADYKVSLRMEVVELTHK